MKPGTLSQLIHWALIIPKLRRNAKQKLEFARCSRRREERIPRTRLKLRLLPRRLPVPLFQRQNVRFSVADQRGAVRLDCDDAKCAHAIADEKRSSVDDRGGPRRAVDDGLKSGQRQGFGAAGVSTTTTGVLVAGGTTAGAASVGADSTGVTGAAIAGETVLALATIRSEPGAGRPLKNCHEINPPLSTRITAINAHTIKPGRFFGSFPGSTGRNWRELEVEGLVCCACWAR